ncbi:MAG: CAP domain-containing protein [Dehalococcoidia bacterium]
MPARLPRPPRALLALLVLATVLASGCVVVTREAPADESPTPALGASPPTTGASGAVGGENGGTGGEADPGGEALRQMERELERRTNTIRDERGLGTLEPREDLRSLGRRYSCRMASEGFFAHEAPGGETVVDRAQEADITYERIGENLARVTNAPAPAEFMMQGWMDSPGHRENILREGFEQIGIGVCRSGETIYATQVFLAPR